MGIFTNKKNFGRELYKIITEFLSNAAIYKPTGVTLIEMFAWCYFALETHKYKGRRVSDKDLTFIWSEFMQRYVLVMENAYKMKFDLEEVERDIDRRRNEYGEIAKKPKSESGYFEALEGLKMLLFLASEQRLDHYTKIEDVIDISKIPKIPISGNNLDNILFSQVLNFDQQMLKPYLNKVASCGDRI